MPVTKTEKKLYTKYQQGSVELCAEFDKLNDRISIKNPDGTFPQPDQWSAAKLSDFIVVLQAIETDIATEL
jgi:hypothetical protein